MIQKTTEQPVSNGQIELLHSLIWARLGSEDYQYDYPWFGLGLLSDYGLPLDVMHMFLAAKALNAKQAKHITPKVMLADTHAITTGMTSKEAVKIRADRREKEARAICSLLDMQVEVIRASTFDGESDFSHILEEVRKCIDNVKSPQAEKHPEYIIRGVADAIHFHFDGGLKVGWSASNEIREGRGRHHEPETDLLASLINPGVGAVYVRPGVTLDPTRPVAVPYTEMRSTSARLMLTGPDRGNIKQKFETCHLRDRKRRIVLENLEIIVIGFETLISSLEGNDLLEKADSLVKLVACE